MGVMVGLSSTMVIQAHQRNKRPGLNVSANNISPVNLTPDNNITSPGNTMPNKIPVAISPDEAPAQAVQGSSWTKKIIIGVPVVAILAVGVWRRWQMPPLEIKELSTKSLEWVSHIDGDSMAYEELRTIQLEAEKRITILRPHLSCGLVKGAVRALRKCKRGAEKYLREDPIACRIIIQGFTRETGVRQIDDIVILIAQYGMSKRTIEAWLRAAYCGNKTNLIKIHQQYKININTTDNKKNTALHKSAEFGHLEIVKYLVGHDIDIGAKNENGYTALQWAEALLSCIQGHDPFHIKETTTYLREHSSKVDKA